jgi:hypothetical protein
MADTDRLPLDERGMALPLALYALVVIGGLVAAGFFVALVEQQSGRNLLFATEVAGVAEGDAWLALSELAPAAARAVPLGSTVASPGTFTAGPGLVLLRQLTRLADNLYLLQSRATREDGAGGQLASRAVGILAAVAADSISGAERLVPISRRAWLQLY